MKQIFADILYKLPRRLAATPLQILKGIFINRRLQPTEYKVAFLRD